MGFMVYTGHGYIRKGCFRQVNGEGSILLLLQIPCFALMTNRQNQDSVLTFLQAIKGHVTGRSARYDQLMQSILHRSADKGVPD